MIVVVSMNYDFIVFKVVEVLVLGRVIRKREVE